MGPTRSLRTLLTEIIDYAGLFPPAKLGMATAVETYNRARIGDHEWMLARFICPVSRLDEFEKDASPLFPGTFARSGYREQADAADPWSISALIDGTLANDLDRIDAFNARHADERHGLARIDMIELKVTDVHQIDSSLDEIPEDIFPAFEFPVTTDCRGFVAALAGEQAAAKIRTGGVVGNAFPTSEEVAAFLHACSSADVPFKATAGLHHPVRGSYRLTYEKDSACHTMHGFLNLFLAAALCRCTRCDIDCTKAILRGEDPADFKIAEEVIGWKGELLTVTDIARVRETFALSFGSCSFDDPIEDLRRLGCV